jgi:predicted amidohydrolase
MLTEAARENKVFIIGGSVPERDGDKLYNTCMCVDESGAVVGKHRKVHLFDIDVKGGIRFKESDTLTAGNSFTIVQHKGWKIGVGICYDVREGKGGGGSLGKLTSFSAVLDRAGPLCGTCDGVSPSASMLSAGVSWGFQHDHRTKALGTADAKQSER